MDMTEMLKDIEIPGLDLTALPDPDFSHLGQWQNVGSCALILKCPVEVLPKLSIELPDSAKKPLFAGWIISIPAVSKWLYELGDLVRFPDINFVQDTTAQQVCVDPAHQKHTEIGIVEAAELLFVQTHDGRPMARQADAVAARETRAHFAEVDHALRDGSSRLRKALGHNPQEAP